MNCFSFYRDHKKLYVGDARGRVYSWSVSDTAGLYGIVVVGRTMGLQGEQLG